MAKYLDEIMPEIRKTGQYILNKKDKEKLEKINNKLNNYKEENIFLLNKNKYIPSKIDYLYIKKQHHMYYTHKNKQFLKMQCF